MPTRPAAGVDGCPQWLDAVMSVESPATGASGRFAPFRYPGYRRYWLGRVVSSAGSAVAPVALAFAILHIGGRTSSLGWVLAAATVPQLFFLLIGGVVADRVSRARVLVVANLLAAFSEGAFAVLVLAGVAHVWQAIAAAFLTGTASAFIVPANQGVIKTLVPRALIKQATALQRSAMNTAKIAGPALAGLLVSIINPGWVLAANALSFVAAALIIASVRADFPAVKARTFMADLRHGWREFWSRNWLWYLTAQGSVGVGVWLVAFQLLGPVYADESLGGAKAWGVIAAAFSVGLLLGSFVSVAWMPDRVGMAVCAAYAAISLFPLALALHANVVVLVLAAALAGLLLDLAIVGWSTYRQLRIPDHLQSRVESYNTLGQLVPVPIGYLAAGLAADLFGVSAVGAVLAALVIVVSAIPLVSPEVRRLSIRAADQPPDAA
ncbi:MFS transporter [Actinoplanes sp. CA-054009]